MPIYGFGVWLIDHFVGRRSNKSRRVSPATDLVHREHRGDGIGTGKGRPPWGDIGGRWRLRHEVGLVTLKRYGTCLLVTDHSRVWT